MFLSLRFACFDPTRDKVSVKDEWVDEWVDGWMDGWSEYVRDNVRNKTTETNAREGRRECLSINR